MSETTDRLNAYTGDNLWEDVILRLDYDEARTVALDPHGRSDVLVLRTGEVCRYDPAAGEWVAGDPDDRGGRHD